MGLFDRFRTELPEVPVSDQLKSQIGNYCNRLPVPSSPEKVAKAKEKEKAKDKEERGTGSGTTGARPKPSSKRWKMLVPSNFPRRPQPYENNVGPVDKYDFVFLPDAANCFRVRKEA